MYIHIDVYLPITCQLTERDLQFSALLLGADMKSHRPNWHDIPVAKLRKICHLQMISDDADRVESLGFRVQ